MRYNSIQANKSQKFIVVLCIIYCFRHSNSNDGAAGRIAGIVVAVLFVCAILCIGVYYFRHGNSSDGASGRIAGIVVAVIFVCAILGIGVYCFNARRRRQKNQGQVIVTDDFGKGMFMNVKD